MSNPEYDTSPATPDAIAKSAAAAVVSAEDHLRNALKMLPPSREVALALTKLDECIMWAEKAFKR